MGLTNQAADGNMFCELSPLLPGSIITPDMARYSPSSTRHKVKESDFFFLTFIYLIWLLWVLVVVFVAAWHVGSLVAACELLAAPSGF